MHIAIDISPLYNAHKTRGTGVYSRRLIEALQKYESQHTYHFFTRGNKVPKNADIVHYPYFDPFFLTLPLYKPLPTVVTVHDLIPLVFPDTFSAGLRGNIKWQIQKMSLKGATRIITDSENSKKDIITYTGINTQKADVVYLAPSDDFRSIHDPFKTKVIQKKYGLPDHFILYVGDVNWNKNILVLLQAFQRVITYGSDSRLRGNDATRIKPKLVLVGKAFLDTTLKETQQINSYIDTEEFNKDVIRIGAVSKDDLVAIFNLASACVQPSMYEGFGLPILEAMACGCPVVTSDASSLAEIAGPAIRVDPNSTESLLKGITTALLLSNKERDQLVKDQLQWVRQFTWKNVARKTIETYEKTVK